MEAIDTLIQDRHLEMMKAAIPYLEAPRQKNIAMTVKLMELLRTMALFQNPENNLRMCSGEEGAEEARLRDAPAAFAKICAPRARRQKGML